MTLVVVAGTLLHLLFYSAVVEEDDSCCITYVISSTEFEEKGMEWAWAAREQPSEGQCQAHGDRNGILRCLLSLQSSTSLEELAEELPPDNSKENRSALRNQILALTSMEHLKIRKLINIKELDSRLNKYGTLENLLDQERAFYAIVPIVPLNTRDHEMRKRVDDFEYTEIMNSRRCSKDFEGEKWKLQAEIL
uniref:Uncharacterized protein n=1 Tax=Nelumbo nucifera TaxID=4432 RepID=A0A822Y7X8_NELNU|nr:TPA_asm: hypothetical protein HUJ06_030005 [Nelumbo nucifera]DAD45797.1 TPA_asm: hypothetical protein HUJ06_004027 [Nelumbo nucifera]